MESNPDVLPYIVAGVYLLLFAMGFNGGSFR